MAVVDVIAPGAPLSATDMNGRPGPELCDAMNREGTQGDAWPMGAFCVLTLTPKTIAGTGLDAQGRGLYCRFKFPANRITDRGPYPLRAQMYGGAPNGVIIDLDAGSFYLPADAQVVFFGGAVGDVWTADFISSARHAPDRELRYHLTTTVIGAPAGPPIVPPFHSEIRSLAGAVSSNGIAVGAGVWVPLSLPVLTTAANTIYQTRGAI